jgi:hypothetical protein
MSRVDRVSPEAVCQICSMTQLRVILVRECRSQDVLVTTFGDVVDDETTATALELAATTVRAIGVNGAIEQAALAAREAPCGR